MEANNSLTHSENYEINFYFKMIDKNSDKNLDYAWEDMNTIEQMIRNKNIDDSLKYEIKSRYGILAVNEYKIVENCEKSKRQEKDSILDYHLDMYRLAMEKFEKY